MTVPCGTRAGSPTGKSFGRAAEVRRIRRAHRHRADERTIGHANDRRVAHRTTVGRDDRQVAAQRPDLDRRDTGSADRRPPSASPTLRRECAATASPCRGARAAICSRSVSPRSTAGGKIRERDSRQAACPATRCTGLQDREQSVVEIRHGERERRHRDRRRHQRPAPHRAAPRAARPARAACRPARAAR